MSLFSIMFLIVATWIYMARARDYNTDRMSDAAAAEGGLAVLFILLYIFLPAIILIILCVCLCRICCCRGSQQNVTVFNRMPTSVV